MKKRYLAVIFSLILLTTSLTTVVNAGLKPSPFRPEEKKIQAIAKSLKAYILPSGELAGWHADPPDKPGYLKGKRNQLSAMTHKMQVLDNRLEKVLFNVPEGELEPSDYPELVMALEKVYDNAGTIKEKTNELAIKWYELESELMGLSWSAYEIQYKAYQKITSKPEPDKPSLKIIT